MNGKERFTEVSRQKTERKSVGGWLKRAAGVAWGVLLPLQAGATCFEAAGEHYGIDHRLLKAIAIVESRMNPKAVGKNANGTVDVGLMQINSSHFPRLQRKGITPEKLQRDPCTSVLAGAEILADFIGRHGYTWRAVGAYNAGSGRGREQARKTYAGKVARKYREIVNAERNLVVSLDSGK
ncbi:lytic transglycosylase domain-containing protein [Burkholderia ubonensis]|uniref:lytic transglycosylase domain-containing protein n=1 Tax=Burkholderia ubonensis TaxID=101571 RepID=UPI0009B3EC13|nr:lytic transglycosylase domain-containing protein [Burkholderia ubonensis]